MSRVRFLCAIAALVAFSATSVAFSACGGGSSDKSNESPQKVLDEATLQGIESGNITISLAAQALGREGGEFEASVSGPFQSEGSGQLPRLDITAEANGSIGGSDIGFDGGLTLLPNRAYVGYEGTEYEVDPTTYSFVESTLKQAQSEGGSAGTAACQEEIGKLKASDFIEDPQNVGPFEVNGVSTTKVIGGLDVSGAFDALLKIVESPACSAQLSAAGPLPSRAEIEKAKGELEDNLESTHIAFFVRDDDILQEIGVQLTIAPHNGGKGPSKVEIETALSFAEVNEEQTISAPPNAKPLSKLFLKLGINPIELLGLLQGEEGGESLGELLKGLAESQTR